MLCGNGTLKINVDTWKWILSGGMIDIEGSVVC